MFASAAVSFLRHTHTHSQYSVNTGIDCDFWLLHKVHGFPAVHSKRPCKFKCLIFIGSPALTEVSACYIFGKCCKSEGKLSIVIPAIDMAVGRRCYLAPDAGIPLIPLHHNYINIDRPLTIVTLLLIGGCQYCVSPNKTYSFITCKLLDKRLWKEYWTRPGLLSWEGCCCDRDFHHLALFVYVCVCVVVATVFGLINLTFCIDQVSPVDIYTHSLSLAHTGT